MNESADRSERTIAIEYLSSVSGLSKERTEQVIDQLGDAAGEPLPKKLPDFPDSVSKDYMLRLLYAAVDSAREMILITDAPETLGEEKIIYANRGAEEMTGYTKEELIGETPTIFQGPDTEEETIQRLLKQLSAGNRFEGETFNYRKDGSRYRVRWSIDPIRDESGEITHYLSVQQDVTSEWEKKKKLEEMVEERESLLGEIHHRVKNNLAVIIGMLELQAAKSSSEEANEILGESINRIQSIATLHEKLYETSDFSNISIEDYLSELLEHLVKTMASGGLEVTTQTDIDQLTLSVNEAVPLALIINELVTNSFKHGFADKNEGTIWISLKCNARHCILTVSDDGVGLSGDLELKELQSLGLRLIDTLSQQLEGSYSFENREPGTTFTLEFSLPE